MTTFHITAPPQTQFNRQTGEHEPLKPYTSPYPVFGVHIVDGKADTDDVDTAIEFADMGYKVEPDPKAAWQELHANDPEPSAEAETDPDALTDDEWDLIAAYRRQKTQEAKVEAVKVAYRELEAKPKRARKPKVKEPATA